jgi:hypothetical protein
VTRLGVHATRQAETWALRFAKAIAGFARHQDRRGVLNWHFLRVCRDSESSFVDVAGLAVEPKVRFRAWIDSRTAPGVVATRELAPRPTLHDVSFWFHSDQQRPIDRVRKSARRYYRVVGRHPAPDARPPLFEVEGGGSVVALGEVFGVPATGRPPNPLAIVDVAFFLVQVGRLHAGLPAFAPTVETYTGCSPGKLLAVPDGQHVLSRFLCPGCKKALLSVEHACESCEWELHRHRVRPYVSPYNVEYDGN